MPGAGTSWCGGPRGWQDSGREQQRPPQVLGSGEAQPRSAGSRFWTWSLRRRVPADAKNFKSSRSPNTGSTLIVSPPSFEANVGKPLGRCAHITHTHEHMFV